MAKSFKELVDKTSNENSRTIAVKRTDELLKEYDMKVTWLDLYNFLYHKAHDLNNLGNFDWSSAIKVVDPETGDNIFKEIKSNND